MSKKARAYIIDGHNGTRSGPVRDASDKAALEKDKAILEKHAQNDSTSSGIATEGGDNWTKLPTDKVYEADVAQAREREKTIREAKEKQKAERARKEKEKREKEENARRVHVRRQRDRDRAEARDAVRRMGRAVRDRSDNDRDRDARDIDRGNTA
ncbi:MAG: hypothetical protein ACSHX0_12015 [Akkermansiaceae bacterium]